MINFKNADTKFQISEKELNEHLCMLVIFCNMNPDSIQAQKLKKHLARMEEAVDKNEFIN